MSAMPEPKLSPEEYLAGERLSEAKHEYLDGEVYAMARANEAHNLIVANLAGELGARLKGNRCEVYASQMRLQLGATGPFAYPDVTVVCQQPRFADAEHYNLLNPGALFEVLSEETEANDRGWKWTHYRQLESLAEFVLVAQDCYQVEQYTRQRDGTWVFREYQSAEDSLRLTSIGCEVPLSEIYYLVEMGGEG